MRSMTRWITRVLALAAAGIAAASAQAPAIVIGGSVAQTGVLADLAADYRKGLLLWESEVNGAGGIGGKAVKLVLLDDASDAVAAGKLYVRLLKDEHAQALLGPYG